MKKVLAALLVVGMSISTAAITVASTQETTKVVTEKAADEALVKPRLFTGLVKKSEEGLMLETSNGSYPLTGLSLETMVDQEVIISGVVKGEEGKSEIFVVKATVKG